MRLKWKKILDEIRIFIILVIIAFAVKTTLVEIYVVPTGSMENTILTGDMLIGNKFIYGMRTPTWIGLPWSRIGFDIPWFRLPKFKKIDNNLIKQLQKLNLISFGNTIEYPIVALKFLKDIARKINKFDGGLLFFDYGYISNKNKNTLQSVKKHKNVNLFFKPGNSDITSHVNFKLFYKILKKNNLAVKKITTQNEFLKKVGILERANILSKKMTFKEKANMFYRLKRLLDYREMGSIFKVLFAHKKGRKFSLGF